MAFFGLYVLSDVIETIQVGFSDPHLILTPPGRTDDYYHVPDGEGR